MYVYWLVTDIVISQDVLEHVFDATAVFREIERTLQPGGIHIFTVPTTSKQFPTFEAATRVDRGNGTFEVLLHAEPEVHGKPSLETNIDYLIVDEATIYHHLT